MPGDVYQARNDIYRANNKDSEENMKPKKWKQEAIESCIRGADLGKEQKLKGAWNNKTVYKLLQHILYLEDELEKRVWVLYMIAFIGCWKEW